jgi:hypothetical protein
MKSVITQSSHAQKGNNLSIIVNIKKWDAKQEYVTCFRIMVVQTTIPSPLD